MPRDINTRLENLRIRRKGVDAARSGRVTASVADEVLRKSVIQESWQRRATEQPYTRYALGAMQAVDPAYTQKSHDEADRVAKQLRSGLSIPIEMRLQGSVPLDVHIRGVSDVDLLVIRTDFLRYDTFGALATSGWYSPSSKTSLSVLRDLRIECEELLKRRYWGADVDCDGGKCIALSGGSFERPVDVVPSHWHDTVDYQASRLEHERGVYILDKKIPDTFSNLPFKHIKRVNERDQSYFGGLKKAIRLVKNVKNDASDESTAAKLPSFDIAALMYHADETSLKAGYVNELHILSEAQRFLDWCYRNKDDAGRLTTPDGLRRILDTEAKHSGLLAISSELDDLAQQVAREQGSLGPSPSWSNVYSTLGSARVPDAA
ncbi:hypothetical protein I5L01_14315 [Erythrobacter sp. YJ-T3-07]|uniref:hypothetical protein n=1 Tax=Erythrobacter sp. YJ-T3-07 TaxID=2793063 RepID=UPI0018D49A38|nr:hypothetical protein [Erythrobacter sp. YJ-T3-07]MBH1945399.1 hypothetical protein [Erythrobacter sp. YJ-T3-07]